MTDFHADNTRFEQLRQDELQREKEREMGRVVEDDDRQYEEGKEPGHLGNDLSKMPLIEEDLGRIAREGRGDREPVEGVQEALRELNEIELPPYPDEEK